MEKKSFVLLMFILLSVDLTAQKMTYTESDALTYQKYLEKDWKGLIKVGKQAARSGLDYYYLNVRMGVAYFYTKKYFNAIRYLEKARRTNPNDDFVNDFLFYAYTYTGDFYRAFSIYQKLPANLKAQKQAPDGTKPFFVDYELSLFRNNDFQTLSSFDYRPQPNSQVMLKLTKNINSFAVGFNKQLSADKFWYQRFYVQNLNYLYINQDDNDFSYNMSDNSLRYYGKFAFLHENALTATLNYNLIVGASHDLQVLTTGPYRGRLIKTTSIYANIAAGASVIKQWHNFKLEPKFNVFIFDGLNAFAGLNVTFYPLSNADLYLSGDFSYNPLAQTDSKYIVKTEAGFRIKKCYFTAAYYYGILDKFVENDGLFLYYTYDRVLNQLAFSVSYGGIYLAVVPALYEFDYTDQSTDLTYSKQYNSLMFKIGLVTNKLKK